MKFLVENYANYRDTQALYLNKALSSSLNVESVLWESSSCSVYDIMDRENPDYYITSIYKLSKDFASYVNNVKNIKLLLNVDYADDNTVQGIEGSILDSGIDCPFFFSSRNVKTKKIRFVHLSHAFDENLTKQSSKIKYKIDQAIFVDSKDQIKEYTGSYHFVSHDESLKENVDITLPENMMFSLYSNYDKILFKNIDNYIPQSLFDAIMTCNNVSYEDLNPEMIEVINKLLKLNEGIDSARSAIMEKHRPQNRAKTILSQIPKTGEKKNERRYSFT